MAINEHWLWFVSGCTPCAESALNDNYAPREACAIDRHVAARLRSLRLARGLSQKDVAAALGIAFQQVQKYESATNRISAGRLYRLAVVLDMPVQQFFDGLPSEIVATP